MDGRDKPGHDEHYFCAVRNDLVMKDRNQIAERLAAAGYIADGELATAISLMALLKRPLLLEGEAGVGKTEVAKALAAVHATELIRLQCYEGLDQSAALYEWNYQRQLLAIQAHRRENLGLECRGQRRRRWLDLGADWRRLFRRFEQSTAGA